MAGSLGIDGLVSGFDTSAILDVLTAHRRKPIDAAALRIEQVNARKAALAEINAKVLAFQRAAQSLRLPSQFNRSVARSSDETLLKVSAGSTSLNGSFSFTPLRQASAAQFVSAGVRDPDRTPVSAQGGMITLELGDARVHRQTDLVAINGGAGFTRGAIRITDGLARSAMVDLSGALTLQEVEAAINAAPNVGVRARIDDTPGSPTFGTALVLESTVPGMMRIESVGGDQTAESLGIAKAGWGGFTGDAIIRLERSTLLSTLNDGRGVDSGTLAINGSINISVGLADARTVGDVLDAINAAGGGVIAAKLDGRGLRITDSGGPAALAITGAPASGLGLGNLIAQGGEWRGQPLIATAGSVLLATVRGAGGGGIAAGSQFTVQDSTGVVTTIDITGHEDMATLIAALGAGAADVTVRVNGAGGGIEITDNAGGNLLISDIVGNAAQQLGIAGAHSGGVDGGTVNVQHLHHARSLESLGAAGSGAMRVGLRDGSVHQISVAGVRTVGELLERLNTISGLDAAINSTGDGIALADTTGGNAELVIEDLSGGTAKALQLAGRFAASSVDRRLQVSVSVSSSDKLNDIMLRLTDSGAPVNVNTFGDGSATNSARLAITARHSGLAGTFMLSSTVAELQFEQAARAQDAVMLMGTQVLHSASGRFDVLPGVSIELLGTASAPVSVSLSRDNEGLGDAMAALVTAYNELNDLMRQHGSFDPQTLEKGLLHGDSSLRRLESDLRRLLLDPVQGVGPELNNLGGIGVRIGRGGKVEFDRAAFMTALETRHADVVRLFTHTAPMDDATPLTAFGLGQGVGTGPGADLRIELRDGSALEVDLDGAVTVQQLLELLNADGRLKVKLGADGRHFEFEDTSNGNATFRIIDANGAGAPVSLGLLSARDSDGDGRISGSEVIMDRQLGVGRRLDFDLQSYTSPLDGMFRRLNDNADQRIAQSKSDIQRLEKAVLLERERIQRQFAVLEQFLAQSQTTQAQLASQLKVIEAPRK